MTIMDKFEIAKHELAHPEKLVGHFVSREDWEVDGSSYEFCDYFDWVAPFKLAGHYTDTGPRVCVEAA